MGNWQLDPDHPEAASVEVTISTASIRTNNGIRDNDLRSSNFLEVDKFPMITFKSTSVEPAGPDRYTLTGDLTIKGNTRPVALQVTRYGEFNDPGMMGHRIAYSATSKINRRDLGQNDQRGPGAAEVGAESGQRLQPDGGATLDAMPPGPDGARRGRIRHARARRRPGHTRCPGRRPEGARDRG